MSQPSSKFVFLGYEFVRTSKGKLRKYPATKSKTKLRVRIRQLTRRTRSGKLEDIIAAINPILKGWFAYFKHSSKNGLNALDGWVHTRLRAILDCRIKKRYSRGNGFAKKRWPSQIFDEHHLFNMEAARSSMLQSARR
jgi:RNA-directed DNA polymerase